MTTVLPAVDLSIVHICTPASVNAGMTATCTITVTNDGPDVAQNLSLALGVGAGLTLSAPPSGGGFACMPAAGGSTCTRPTAASGASFVVTYRVTVPAHAAYGTMFANTATVTNDVPERNAIDDTATSDLVVANSGPVIAISNTRVLEGDSGAKQALHFSVTLSKPSQSGPITVQYSTIAGTATVANHDYVAKRNKTLTFLPGQVSKPVTVTINPDRVIESDETVGVDLLNPTNAVLAASHNKGIGTILDDDSYVGNRIAIGTASVVEGDTVTRTIVLPISISTRAASPITVFVSTTSGTAVGVATPKTCCGDYVRVSKTLAFTTTQTTKNLVITLLPDALAEGNETFTVTLAVPPGYTVIGGSTVTIAIADDD